MKNIFKVLFIVPLFSTFACSMGSDIAGDESTGLDESSEMLSAVAAGTVAWTPVDGSTTIDLGTQSYGTAIDLAIFYKVAGVSKFGYSLRLDETSNGVTNSSVLQQPATNGSNGIRPGYDPSNCQLGDNLFTYRLRLMKGATMVSTSTFMVKFTMVE